MKKSKKKRVLLLTILSIAFLMASMTSLIFIQSDFDYSENEKNDVKGDIFSEVKNSQYDSFESSGESINVTLHQSYLNKSFNTALNTSDSNNNSITLPCPTETTFNSSYTKLNIEDIFTPNKTLEIETNTSQKKIVNNVNHYAFSFRVLSDSYLENFSISLSSDGIGGGIAVDLYNASSTNHEPDTEIASDIHTNSTAVPNGASKFWYNVQGLNEFLDVSNTYNNTFYIDIRVTDIFNDDINYHYEDESNGDDSRNWRYASGSWIALDNEDASLIVDLKAYKKNPKPSDINLRVNNILVSDIADGSGYWESFNVNGSVSGDLIYTLTADWWEVTCNISQVQINYTKTDLQAFSTFSVNFGNYVNWNVSINEAINSFDDRIEDFNTINFTIPSNWDQNYIRVFNGSNDEKTVNIPSTITNGYREIQVLGAGNGANWYLTGNSTNLIQNLHTYVEGEELEIMNYSDIIDFKVNFTESVSNGEINNSIFSPAPRYLNHSELVDSFTAGSEIDLSSWIIADNITDYGFFLVQVSWSNGTAAGFFEKNITIFAETDLILNSELDLEYFDNNQFNISVIFNDTKGSNPSESIIGGNISTYNATTDFIDLDWYDAGNGTYFIEVNTSDFSYGINVIEIEAFKEYYNNASVIFSFQKVINTTISPANEPILPNTVRGDDASYPFNYSDINGNPILGAKITETYLPKGFESILDENASGNYTITLITDNVTVSDTPYNCTFKISAEGNETQILNLSLTVIMTETEITNISYLDVVDKPSGLNQTIEFYFNDRINIEPVVGLTTQNIIVINESNGQPWNTGDFNWSLHNGTGDGNYILNLSTNGIQSGEFHEITINASKSPNYNWSLSEVIRFYFAGNETQINLLSLSHPLPGGQLEPIGSYNFTAFAGNDLELSLNISYNNYPELLASALINQDTDFEIRYQNVVNVSDNGFLPTHDDPLNKSGQNFNGFISSSILDTGRYLITIIANSSGYEIESFSFNLTLEPKYEVNIEYSVPLEITAGDTITLTLNITYFNGTHYIPISGLEVQIIPCFDGVTSTELGSKFTNSSGMVTFEITVGRDVQQMNISIPIDGSYNYNSKSITITEITVNPAPGLNLEDFLPYLIIIAAIIGVAGIVAGVYRGVVLPKKHEKQRILKEVKTMFEDAVNLEHLLVLYKGSGTCIFFRSFGSDKIDPDLISGFISAVSSFGREVESQKALNEIKYGDKTLLLADGEYIRVALVLSKSASLILRDHLKNFINAFEEKYMDFLPKWRGQLNIFRDAGHLIDENFHTSIILPHKLEFELSDVKKLKKPQSREILGIAQDIKQKSEREFFFISSLLDNAMQETNKGVAEIFMGIKELRENEILVPIDISRLEKRPITPEERRMIEQRLAEIGELSDEEKKNILDQLSEMTPEEREAYMASLREKEEIVSAPVKSKVGETVIEDKKQAKKEIKKLMKKAKKERGIHNYEKAIEIYKDAGIIANNWDMKNAFEEIQDIIRLTQIDQYELNMKDLEREAQKAAKNEDFEIASKYYKHASELASKIFKLGVTEMQDNVKEYTKKSKEFEKLIK